MRETVIKIENVSKQYRLGQISTGSLAHDINRWWYAARGKENPYLKIGEENDRTRKGTSEYVWALRDISFDVQQGDVLGIIGRNGAGKSTLLKILSRTTLPTTGSIKAKGRIASLLEVGTGFHPELTGRENIFLNGAILGMTRREITSKFDEIVDFSGVEKYIDTPVKRYSSGMYVRLAFAVAAHLEPEILIVDEVLAVGDAEFQKKCLGKMKDVSQHGRTILFVSHSMIAIESICNCAMVLNKGQIDFTGNVNDSIKKYLLSDTKTDESNSLIDLPRSGNGKIKFTKIIFYDEEMNKVTSPMSGKKLIIALEYKTTDTNVRNIRIGISVNNGYYGSQLTAMANDVSGDSFSNIPSEGVFFCTIPKLSIVSGIYNLNLFCSVNGDIADWLINVFNFNVIGGDFYSTGRNMDSGQSQFLMDYNWNYAEKI
jgi:lipopolysaccharide transport system ATP-binding protein